MANGANNNISWDDVVVQEATVPAQTSTWSGIKARYR
jgi:hypothetical protein